MQNAKLEFQITYTQFSCKFTAYHESGNVRGFGSYSIGEFDQGIFEVIRNSVAALRSDGDIDVIVKGHTYTTDNFIVCANKYKTKSEVVVYLMERLVFSCKSLMERGM